MNLRFLPTSIDRLFITVTTILIVFGFPAFAQTPTYSYNPSSTTANSFPLSSSSSNKVEWLLHPSDFSSSPSGAVNITTIYIKPGNTASSGGTFTNLQIKMGNTSSTCLSSGTWTSGLTTVYSATSTTISSWSSTGWVPITLQTPFYYSGTSNFIVSISQTGYTTGMTVRQGTISGCNRRRYGSASGSSSSGSDTRLLAFGFDSSPATCSGTPSSPYVSTSTMSAASPLCAGGTKALTAVDPNQPINGITYQWQTATTATGPWANVTNGTGATTLNYTTGSVTSTRYYRIAAKCSTSNLSGYSAAYQILVGAPQPSNIIGNASFCTGDTATYSVTNTPGTTYTWSLPSGWTGTSTTNSILVTPGSTGGTISVSASSSCGTSIANTRTIVPGGPPAQPSSITGKAYICANTSQTYSVTPVSGATSYLWTLPSGWSGTSTSNTITASTNGSGGTIAVQAVSGCGQSSARTMTVNVITALANPGTITGPTAICAGSLNSYSINPVPGATSYTWTFPSGWSGSTSGTSIQAFAGSTSGNVNVTAFVSCATSPTAAKAVTVTPTLTPAVSVATTATVLCQGSPITFTATPTNGGTTPQYQWKKNGTSVAGSGNTYLSNTLATGDVISVVMTSSYACASTPTAASSGYTANVTPAVVPGININTTPTVHICQGTPLTFITNITGGGSAPAYQWYKNGIPVASATSSTYTDAGLIDLDTITVKLTSNAVCATSTAAISNKVLVNVADTIVPSITITASSTILNGDPITFTATQSGGGATPDYQWMKNNVDIPNANTDTYIATGLNNGDLISVKMLSYAPCATPALVTSNEIEVNSPLSVNSVAGWEGKVSLYPNPNTGHFSVAASWGASHIGKRVSIEIMNTIGQSIYHSEVAPDKAEWHYDIQMADALPNGHYILHLCSSDGMKAVTSFTLNR